MKTLFYVICAACFMLSSYAEAKTYEECGIATKASLVLASVAATPAYLVFKLPLAAAGAALAAPVNFLTLKYADEFAEPLALRTMYGDWYITPAILHGDRQLQYFGPVD